MTERQREYATEVLQRELNDLRARDDEFFLREEQDALEQAMQLVREAPDG
jgi:hypothetical protein